LSPDVFLLKFWGWLLTLVCGTYILRPSTCKRILTMMEDHRFVVVTGWFSLILGVGTVVGSSKAPLKLLGIAFTVSGIVRLSFPDKMAFVSRFLKEKPYIPLSISFIGLLIGIYFIIAAGSHLPQGS